MGPSLAESSARRFWPLGVLLAITVAFATMRPEPPRDREYKQFKRVGKCVNGKRVYQIVPQ